MLVVFISQRPDPGHGAKEAVVMQLEVIEFLLSQQRYGVESHYITRVYPLKEYTPLPCTPPFIMGIVNVRGQIISVVNLQLLLGLPEAKLHGPSHVIILRDEQMTFGLVADGVLGVRHLALAELRSPPDLQIANGNGFLRGVIDQDLLILDAAELLSSRQLVIQEEVEG